MADIDIDTVIGMIQEDGFLEQNVKKDVIRGLRSDRPLLREALYAESVEYLKKKEKMWKKRLSALNDNERSALIKKMDTIYRSQRKKRIRLIRNRDISSAEGVLKKYLSE